jgi:cation diffusion facilitator family transporter
MQEKGTNELIAALENPRTSNASSSDPLNLRRYYQNDIDQIKNPKLKEFYENQNNMIDAFLSPPGTVEYIPEQDKIQYKIAVYGSFAANFLLFLLQLSAAIVSRSMVFFATSADAFMDLTSSLVLIVSGKLASSDNYIRFPTGKERYKTAGIIVFSTLMSTLALQLIVESIKKLIDGQIQIEMDLFTYIAISIAFVSKLILLIYCRMNSDLESVAVLAQDHLNDVLFNTTGAGLAILSSYTLWWLDPAGAILIAIIIFRTWFLVGMEHVLHIVGRTAEPEKLNRYVYLAMTHNELIEKVDTVRAYHSGSNLYVEVDISFPPETPLRIAHNIGEELQEELEMLPEVDRAFVHLDYETTHQVFAY